MNESPAGSPYANPAHRATSEAPSPMPTPSPAQPNTQRRPGYVRINAELPEDDVEVLAKIAHRNNLNRTSALARALRTTELIEETVRGGGRVILEMPDGSRKEIVVP
ncbi:MAG TPA: hypothetical protein VFR74_13525 [Jiangellales bacterium]|nr:hypothetical protein [Jiangellales bacterium]